MKWRGLRRTKGLGAWTSEVTNQNPDSIHRRRSGEKIPRDNPYGSKDEMLRQLAVGDEKEAQKRLKVQVLASKAKALQRHGGNRRSEDFQGSHANLENGDMPTRGVNSEYLLALLQRDHPEILARVIEGEFLNVRAAARAAGIALVQPNQNPDSIHRRRSGMSQDNERYEGISEDRTVEVIMESSYVLEALRAPVFVDDLGDFRGVGRALLEAWQERVPGFGVDMQISHGSGEVERLCSVGVVVQWIAAPEDDFTSTVSRQGIAAIKAGEDPWDAYLLAATRASWLWGLEAREMTKSDQQLKSLLIG